MVGIVIVAHSAALAEAIQKLARQMLRQQVPIAAVGGTDNPENPFGTDATQIHRAIESVYSNDGVIVLMDMGSALLSAETSLEFLTEAQRSRVRLCEAPLVEGTIIAAVRSEAGGSLEQVIGEARGALAAKAAQLQAEVPEISFEAPQKIISPAGEIQLTVRNPLGIHARPAARFVTTAAQFQSEITVRNVTRNTGAVSTKSINLIATLGVRQGHEIAISAAGADASEALKALKELVENNLGDTDSNIEKLLEKKLIKPPLPVKDGLAGIAVAPGIAIGPAVLYQTDAAEIPAMKAENPEAEWRRLQAAIHSVQQEIQKMRMKMSLQAGDYEAAIFDAHLLFLEDPALLEAARQRIFEKGEGAEASWRKVLDEMKESYNAVEDPYLRSRGVDLTDLESQVLRLLTGNTLTSFKLTKPAIIVAADLSPSDIARLELDKVSGICTAFGGANSHSSILARALGIPAVAGVGLEVLRLAEGTQLVLDGSEGRIWMNPHDIEAFQKKQEAQTLSRKVAQKASRKPAVTLDGCHVKVVANAGSIAEVKVALAQGAEGIGLLRTEFLFLGRETAPSEEEQFTVYKNIAELLGKCSLVIRTLDVGGDKRLAYLDLPLEANPFLGYRGIRLCLDRLDIFKAQLRAILRASFGHQVKIIFPMVSSIGEVRRIKEVLWETQDELKQAGVPYDGSMEIGIMIEVPAAVAIADCLAKEVDFFSIGTNDLSQYAMAADRTNPRVAPFSDALNPAVLRLICQTVKAGHDAGIWVGICGEMAGDELAISVLLGSGIDELSMSALVIPAVKQVIARLKMSDAADITDAVLNLDSAEDVRRYVTERFLR